MQESQGRLIGVGVLPWAKAGGGRREPLLISRVVRREVVLPVVAMGKEEFAGTGAGAAAPAGARGLRSLVLGSAVLFALVGRGIGESFAVFLLPLQQSFAFSRAEATAIYAVMVLAVGFGGPWAGMLFDRLGPRALYGAGAALLVGGTFLASWAQSFWQLALTIGVVIGMGTSCVGIAGQTPLLGRWFPGRIGTALGVVGAATGLGVLICAPIAQILIDAHGWREAYRILGTAAVVVLLPMLVFLPWRRLQRGAGESVPASSRAFGAASGTSFGAAFADPVLWALVVGFGLTAAATFSVQPQLVGFFVAVGYSPLEAASWLGVGGLAASAGMVGFGWLGDRLGPAAAVWISYAATALGLAVLASMLWVQSFWQLPLYVLTFGATLGSRGPLVMAIAARRWTGPALGRISGLIVFGFGLGGGGGALAGGYLHDLGGDALVFVVAAGLLAMGAVAFAAAFRRQGGTARGVPRVGH